MVTKSGLPVDIDRLVAAAISLARGKLEAGAEFPGVAFVDAPGVPDHAAPGIVVENGLMAVPMVALPTKDAWARFCRTIARFVEARFVVVVSEIWIKSDVGDREAFDKLRAQHGGEVRLMPGSREAIMVQVETHDGLWMGTADLTPCAGGKTFGELKLTRPGHMEGRLLGLLTKGNRH